MKVVQQVICFWTVFSIYCVLSVCAEIALPDPGGAQLVVAATNGPAGGGDQKPEKDVPLSLAIDLSDGCRIKGVPAIEAILLKTSFAEVKPALKLIESLKFSEDGKTVVVQFLNGDKLEGSTTVVDITLETLMGKCSIPVKHIAGIDVVQAGGSPAVLLLHCNGPDGSQTFVDSSGANRGVTAAGNAQINAGVKKFGNGAVRFNGSGDYLKAAGCPAFDFGTGDFTIDGWVNPAVAPSIMRLVGGGADSDGANKMWFFGFGNGWGNGFKMNFGYYNGGNNGYKYTERYDGSPITVTAGTWNHWALVRSGSHILCFWNGIKNLDWDMGKDVAINTGPSGLIIGARYHQNGGDAIEYVNGFMDEIRVSKGAAKWKSDFKPPAAEGSR